VVAFGARKNPAANRTRGRAGPASHLLEETTVNTTTARLLGLGLLMLTAGCGSGISVNHDYDVNAHFEDYDTYAWIERSMDPATGNAQAAQTQNDLLDARIKSAVSNELDRRGLVENTKTPDVLLTYHLGVQDKIAVQDWGYRYSDYYWGYGGRQIDVYNYQEGTLIIDIIDASRQELVWRGAGQKNLRDTRPTPEQITQEINHAVGKIMEAYPPPRRK
jgi:hypothetical protein